jgi:hypothetical protein
LRGDRLFEVTGFSPGFCLPVRRDPTRQEVSQCAESGDGPNENHLVEQSHTLSNRATPTAPPAAAAAPTPYLPCPQLSHLKLSHVNRPEPSRPEDGCLEERWSVRSALPLLMTLCLLMTLDWSVAFCQSAGSRCFARDPLPARLQPALCYGQYSNWRSFGRRRGSAYDLGRRSRPGETGVAVAQYSI